MTHISYILAPFIHYFLFSSLQNKAVKWKIIKWQLSLSKLIGPHKITYSCYYDVCNENFHIEVTKNIDVNVSLFKMEEPQKFFWAMLLSNSVDILNV